MTGIFIPAGPWTFSNEEQVYGRALPNHRRRPVVDPARRSCGSDQYRYPGSRSRPRPMVHYLRISQPGVTMYTAWTAPASSSTAAACRPVRLHVWVEHFICMYWGVNASNNTFENCRIWNTFADGINMTNSSSNNTITNCDARATGDDSFAEFSAVDSGGSYNVGNQFTYLTATCTRRAANFAAYGGYSNNFQNCYGAGSYMDPGITINSYNFGYSALGFGSSDTTFNSITLDRCGGNFWTDVNSDEHINNYQNFAAIWFYANEPFQNILVQNVDINSPEYFGMMFQCDYPNPYQ